MRIRHCRLPKSATSLLRVSIFVALCVSSCKSNKTKLVDNSTDMLKYLPSFSTVVVGASWSKLQESELFKKYKDRIQDRADKELREMKRCGIDLLTDLESVVIAAQDIDDGDSFVIALKGRFTRKQIEDCYYSQGGSVKDGTYTRMGSSINAYWPNANIVVLSSTQSASALEQNGKSGGLTRNPRMMKLISKLRDDSTLWAAGLIPKDSRHMANLTRLGQSVPEEGHLSLVVSAKLNVQIGLIFDKKKAAKEFDQLLKVSLAKAKSATTPPGISALFDDVASNASNHAVTLKAEFDEEKILMAAALRASL